MRDYTNNFYGDRQFSVGSILSRTFSTLFKNPLVYFGLPLLVTIPAAIFVFVFQSTAGIILGVFAALIFGLAIQGAIAYAVYQGLKGNVASIGDALRLGMSRIGTIILATILVGLCVGLGTLLLFIPGIIITCMLAVTIQACVIERLGATESLGRSADLTNGYRLKIFCLVLLLYIGTAILNGLCQSIFGASVTGEIFSFLISLAVTSFSSVMYATIYYDLRMVKEGASLDTLANVFD